MARAAVVQRAASMLQIAEMSGRARLMDELEYALDGMESGSAIRRESCVRVLELCKNETHALGLLLRSQGLFSRLFALLPICANDGVVALCVAGTFMLLLADEAATATYIDEPFVHFLRLEISHYGISRDASQLAPPPTPLAARSPVR
jgi:hypothetical protein